MPPCNPSGFDSRPRHHATRIAFPATRRGARSGHQGEALHAVIVGVHHVDAAAVADRHVERALLSYVRELPGAMLAVATHGFDATSGLRLSSTMSGTSEHGKSGAWQFACDDPPQRILDFYQRELESKGFDVTVNATRQGGRTTGGMLHATVDDGRQTVAVAVTGSGSGSEGTITFEAQSGE